jgi:DnaJ-class molecular chaperone
VPGYDLSRLDYARCTTCRGDGSILELRSDAGRVWKERVTCPAYNGAGGRPGADEHDHA